MERAGGRVLITGANGFTGRYLSAELGGNGYEVLGVGSAESAQAGHWRIDLADVEGLRDLLKQVQPDIVIHLAALAFVGHGEADDFYRVNVLGTRHLLEAIADSGKRPRSVLLASSANVYGNASAGALDESTPPAPANDYAVSKLAMEYMARLWAERLPITIARPFNYTGVGQASNFLLPKIVEHFRQRATRIELGNLDVSRDFSDVRTVVHLYKRMIESPAGIGGTYNISSGEAYSLQDVLDICSDLTGHRIEVVVNPAFVRANEVKVLRGDNERLRRLVGDWQAPTLRETLAWMLDAP